MPGPGSKAPELTGVLADGSRLALRDLRGRPLVVYFYPKDNTPGCTLEAQEFRDRYPEFQRRRCEVIGVSRDSAASHCRFRDRHALPFPLVADTDETWCRAFGVLGEKLLYGRRSIGVIRSSFLIDPEGTIVASWRKPRPAGHAAAVLAALEGIA